MCQHSIFVLAFCGLVKNLVSVPVCLENALWEQGQLMAASHWVQEMVPSTLRAHRNINCCWFPDLLFEYVKWPLRGFQRVNTLLPIHDLHRESLTWEGSLARCNVCSLCKLDEYTQEDVGSLFDYKKL